jgi:predicted DNA-binding transcriptional regulator AlpA
MTLDALAAAPMKVSELTAEERASLIVQVAGLLAALGAAVPPPAAPETADQLLTAEEAAHRLGATKDWLRRRPELPFVVKLSEGVVRYSSHGLARWVAARVGRGAC